MGFFDTIGEGIKEFENAFGTQNTPPTENDGFSLPITPSADGNSLPSGKIGYEQESVSKRHLMHWFVPEFGIIKMYVNPQSVSYSFEKIISKERTKGGYVLQYWGEELPVLSISGTTGSSGVEGINILYEIYRAEQYAFDPIGLSLAASSSAQAIQDTITNIGSSIGGDLGGTIGSGIGSILGLDPSTNGMIPQNIPTLAYLAFGVELFYSGWVFRGYFKSLRITESVSNLGMFDYEINFIATQRRGYRTNQMPWHKSANQGPSGDGIPYSFKK